MHKAAVRRCEASHTAPATCARRRSRKLREARRLQRAVEERTIEHCLVGPKNIRNTGTTILDPIRKREEMVMDASRFPDGVSRSEENG